MEWQKQYHLVDDQAFVLQKWQQRTKGVLKPSVSHFIIFLLTFEHIVWHRIFCNAHVKHFYKF